MTARSGRRTLGPMTYTYLPKNLPELFRKHGLTVIEIAGWEHRGRPVSTGEFDTEGVLNHHTGSYDGDGDPKDDLAYAQWLALTGRPDLPAPLAHISISHEGVVYILAAGRANHAGVAKASGSMSGGDGNKLYIGIEVMNSGTQGFSGKQLESLVLVNAILNLEVTGNSEQSDRGHKETSVTGKWDPGALDMDAFRAVVRIKMRELKAPAVRPRPKVKSRIQRFREGGPIYDLNLLDEAIKGGRTGTVKEVRDGIDREVRRLRKVKASPLLSVFLEAYAHDTLRLGSLAKSVSNEHRSGTVKSVLVNIRALIARLDGLR